eukprot:g3360.t1
MTSSSSGSSSGAPLKPWELARMQSTGTVSGEVSTRPYTSPSLTPEDEQQRQQTQQIIPSYPNYSRYTTTNYGSSPYHPSPSPYGMSNGYYGYPSSYTGGGMYGGYGRPTGWPHQQPMYPGLPPPGGDAPKPPMWQRFIEGLHKVVSAFGRVSFLVDENTQAFHFFITALLALMDKAGSLYGELMRYIMKLMGLGRRRRRTIVATNYNKQGSSSFEKEQVVNHKPPVENHIQRCN